MRRTLQFICCLTLLALSASAQVQTIFVGDNGNVSLTKINANFNYLNLNKAQVYAGSGAPGLIAASRLGDFYVRTDTFTTYQCYAATCNTVAAGNWQLLSGGGGGGGCVPFGGVNQVLVDSGAGNCLSTGVTIAGTTITGSLDGNALTASALQTSRLINGVPFNGSSNITVSASASTLTGTALSSGITTSNLTSFGNGPSLLNPTLSGATTLAITGSTQCLQVNTFGVISGTGGACAGTPAFSAITSGTNTTASMVIGTGASLSVTGSGTIAATSAAVLATARTINGTNFDGSTNITISAAAATLTGSTLSSGVTASSLISFGNNPTLAGSVTLSSITGSTQCLHVSTGGVISGTGSDCGAGGSAAFSSLTSGTNTTAAMVVGSGASLAPTGSGAITATVAPVAGLTGAGTGVLTALSITADSTGGFCVVGGSGCASGTARLLLNTSKTAATVLTINAGCSSTTPCNVGIGGTVYQFTTSATATITAGTGTAFIYVSSAGVLTVASNVTVTCSGCTAVVGTSFPVGSAVGYRWTATSTVWDTSGGTDFRPQQSSFTVASGAGISIATTSGIPAVAIDFTSNNTWSGTQTFGAVTFGAITGSTQCLHVNSAGLLSGTGSDCGSGGSTAFNALTSGTNTTAAMVVGSGGTLGVSGSGTIAATSAPIAGLTGAGTGVLTALAANVSGTGAICLASGSACAGGGGSPGGSNTQIQYNNSGAFGGISGATSNGTVVTLTNPSLTGTVTNTQGTLTGSSTPAYTHTVTFNNAATPFTDDFRNITNTASDFGSNFVKWQVNGSDRYTFNLAGDFQAYGGSVTTYIYYVSEGGVIRGYAGGGGDATTISFPEVGKLLLSNYVGSDFSMLLFGTATSADPALKLNGTTIEAKLADDSAYTTFTALQVQSKVTTVGSLGTCNSGAEGTRRGVTDALTPVALGAVTGGGSVHVGVYCDGTNWIVQ